MCRSFMEPLIAIIMAQAPAYCSWRFCSCAFTKAYLFDNLKVMSVLDDKVVLEQLKLLEFIFPCDRDNNASCALYKPTKSCSTIREHFRSKNEHVMRYLFSRAQSLPNALKSSSQNMRSFMGPFESDVRRPKVSQVRCAI